MPLASVRSTENMGGHMGTSGAVQQRHQAEAREPTNEGGGCLLRAYRTVATRLDTFRSNSLLSLFLFILFSCYASRLLDITGRSPSFCFGSTLGSAASKRLGHLYMFTKLGHWLSLSPFVSYLYT